MLMDEKQAQEENAAEEEGWFKEWSDALAISPWDSDAPSLPMSLKARYYPEFVDGNDAEKPIKEEEKQLLLASGYDEIKLSTLNNTEKRVLAQEEYVYSHFFPAEKAAIRKVGHWVNGVIGDWKDNPDFSLASAASQDGFSLQDQREFFDGVTTEREYDYVKSGLLKERALKEFYNSLSAPEQLISDIHSAFLNVVTVFGELGAAKGAIGKLRLAFPNAVGKACNTYEIMMEHIPYNVVRSAVQGGLIGTVDGFKEYASQYEFSEEDMIKHAGGFMACNLAFTGIKGGAKLASKMFASAYDLRPIEQRVMDAFPSEGKKLSAMQKFHRFMDTNPITGSPVKRMLWNEYSPTLRDYAKKLCVISEGEGTESQEIWAAVQRNKLNYLSQKFFSEMNSKAVDIEKETGKSLIRWLDVAIENRGEGTLPFAAGDDVNKFAKSLLHLRDEITQGAKKDVVALSKGELTLELPDTGTDFLSGRLAVNGGEVLTPGQLLTEYMQTNLPVVVKPVYVPRHINIEMLQQNKKDFLNVLKNGKINEFFQNDVRKTFELKDELSITPDVVKDLERFEGHDAFMDKMQKVQERLQHYINSNELQSIVEGQYKQLLKSPKVVNELWAEELSNVRRTIRVDDAALTNYFGMSAFEGVYANTNRLITHCAHKKVLANFSARNSKELRDKIESEIIDALESRKITGNEFKKIQNGLLKDYDLTSGLFTNSHSSSNSLMSLNLCLYGLVLGKTVINSLCDGVMMISRFGLKDYLHRFALGLPEVVEKGLKGVSKEQMKKVLDILPYGISDGSKDYLVRALPSFMDLGYSFEYRGNKFARFARGLSASTYKYSGLEAWDYMHKRTVRQIILQELRENPGLVKGLTSENLEHQIESLKFDDKVMSYIAHKTMSVINRPSIIDTPGYAYNDVGRLFFTFKGWSYAFTRNFLRPLLRGDFQTGKIIEGGAWLAMTSIVSEYLRSFAKGKPYDFADEKQLSECLKNACVKGLNDMAGYYTIGTSLLSNVTAKKRSSKERALSIVTSQAPLLSKGLNIGATLIKNLSNLSIGLYEGEFPRNSARDLKWLLKECTPNYWQKEALINNFVKERNARRH